MTYSNAIFLTKIKSIHRNSKMHYFNSNKNNHNKISLKNCLRSKSFFGCNVLSLNSNLTHRYLILLHYNDLLFNDEINSITRLLDTY